MNPLDTILRFTKVRLSIGPLIKYRYKKRIRVVTYCERSLARFLDRDNYWIMRFFNLISVTVMRNIKSIGIKARIKKSFA